MNFNYGNWSDYEIKDPKKLSDGGYVVFVQDTYGREDYGQYSSVPFIKTYLFKKSEDQQLMVKALAFSNAAFTFHKLGSSGEYKIQVKEPTI